MRLSRYFFTFSFRLGLILFLGFSTTLISLRVLFYKQLVDNAYADIQGTLATYQTFMAEGMESYGGIYVRDLVERIAAESKDGNLIIAYDEGARVTGNLAPWPPAKQSNQWYETRIEKDGRAALHLYYKTIRYSDHTRLLLGYNLQKIDKLKETLLRVLAGHIALSLLLSLILSTLVVLVLNRSLARVNDTCREVMNGHLGHRVKVGSDFDQFDRLGGNINRMLDWISALLETAKDSSNALAHDMRTPLSRHRLELRAILDNPKLPPDTQNQLQSAIEHIDKLADMIDNILSIAKAESRSGTELFENVNLNALAADILDFYAPMIEGRGITLTQKLPNDPLTLLGDKQLLSQAFMNLTDNAVKYTPVGGTISVSLARDGRGIALSVSDSGDGIPPDMLEKAKERFFRLDKSRHTEGTGLGLSLVQAVMKLHQGRLDLENKTPGLCATLVFPV